MNRKFLGVVLVVALAVGGYLIYTQYAQQGAEQLASSTASAAAAVGTPKISIAPSVRDLGDVSTSKGTVSTSFAIENTGTGDLVIRDMETSCMCTEAAVVIGDREGPRFGMRGMDQRPVGWSARLNPGEKATLKVYYDPTAHGDLRGPVTRQIRIYTNDLEQPSVDVTIELNQVN